MAKIYYQEDCNLNLLKGKKIAVIGNGSQHSSEQLSTGKRKRTTDFLFCALQGGKESSRGNADRAEKFRSGACQRNQGKYYILYAEEYKVTNCDRRMWIFKQPGGGRDVDR